MAKTGDRKLDIASFKELTQEGGTQVLAQTIKGLPHGLGFAFKPDQESYKGFWKQGVFEGLGILSIGNEHTYCGNFSNGKSVGFGLLRKGKDLIFGEFDFDSLTGSGSYSKPDLEYRGYFTNGTIDGFGKFTDKRTNEEYAGHFVKGVYSREGKLTTATERYVGSFANGKKTGAGHQRLPSGEQFWGYWSAGVREAFGRLETPDGRVYIGEWKAGHEVGACHIEHKMKEFTYLGEVQDGLRSGIGKLEFKNYVYVGMWNDNKKNGLGIQTMKDGSVYFGFWANNLKEGLGKETGPNINYQGEWKAGQPHGKGILITEKDALVYVKFEEGKITSTLLQSEVEQVEKELEYLKYEEFRNEAERKLKEHQKQINSSQKLLDERLLKIGNTIETELSEFTSLMDKIELKADEKVKSAKELEKIIDWVVLEHSKKGNTLTNSPKAIQIKHEEKVSIEKKDQTSNIIENTTKTQHDKNDSQENKTLIKIQDQESEELQKDTKARTESSIEKDNSSNIALQEQAERLAAYEKWLLKETQKLKDSRSPKKIHKINTEYSTKSMIEAEKEKVRKIFTKEFDRLSKDIEDLRTESKNLKESNEFLDTRNKKLEGYSNDVDVRNFNLKSDFENLCQESTKKYKEYDAIILELKSQISNLKSDLSARNETIKVQEEKIDETTMTNSHLSTELEKEQTKASEIQLKYIRAVVEIHAIRIACEVYNEETKTNLKSIEELKQKNSKQVFEMEELRKSIQELNDSHKVDLQEQQAKHNLKLEQLDKERLEISEVQEQEIARLKRQIRVLETGGEVEDTEEKLRAKELEDNRNKMKELRDESKKLKNTIESNELEIGNLKKMVTDRDKSLKDTSQKNYELELIVNQLEETVRGFHIKQKEWSDMKEALANNIKMLKEREQELKNEVQSKKVMEREELTKRNEKLSKNFFDDSIKPKVLLTLGSLF